MPNIDNHQTGNFCWVELGADDQHTAKPFYAKLFGWTANDIPMGPGGVYTMFALNGKTVAAGYTLTPELRAQHVPPHWLLYVAVSDVDATVAKVTELGGKVMNGPFDAGEAGRMAVLQDPARATFAIWQARQNPGLDVTGEENALCWADLSTPEPEEAKTFYEKLLDWKITPGKDGEGEYLHIQNGGEFIGGIPPAAYRNPQAPSHWLAYFQTADCDASVAKAQEAGATVAAPPMSMPNVGRFAVLADPQGAMFALFEPQDAA